MQRRRCEHYRPAVTPRAAQLAIARRLADYLAGYVDRHAERGR